jgi:hypothetical protein
MTLFYRQKNFNQLKIIVTYVDIIGLCHSVAIFWEVYVMRHKCHVWWHNFHLKGMLITGLCQKTLILYIYLLEIKSYIPFFFLIKLYFTHLITNLLMYDIHFFLQNNILKDLLRLSFNLTFTKDFYD